MRGLFAFLALILGVAAARAERPPKLRAAPTFEPGIHGFSTPRPQVARAQAPSLTPRNALLAVPQLAAPAAPAVEVRVQVAPAVQRVYRVQRRDERFSYYGPVRARVRAVLQELFR